MSDAVVVIVNDTVQNDALCWQVVEWFDKERRCLLFAD